MKRIKILLILIISVLNLKAQFAPVNAVWHFGLPDGNGVGIERFMKYIAYKDTLINNEVYSVIGGFNEVGVPIQDLKFLIMQKNDTLFYHYQNDKKIFYNLNVKVGDTTVLDLYQNKAAYITKVLITKMEWIKRNLLANDSLKKYTFYVLPGQLAYNGYGTFTERIIVPNCTGVLIAIGQTACIPEGNPYVRCYSDSNYQFKNKIFTQSCNFINVGIEDHANPDKIKVYPNPANNRLFVEFGGMVTGKYMLSIYNYMGQLLRQYNPDQIQSNGIDISDLPLGFYFLELGNDLSKYRSNFLKQ